MAHAAASIKKARVEMEQAPDLKALEKAREKRRRSRERAERRRKVMQAPLFSISPYLHQSTRDTGPPPPFHQTIHQPSINIKMQLSEREERYHYRRLRGSFK